MPAIVQNHQVDFIKPPKTVRFQPVRPTINLWDFDSEWSNGLCDYKTCDGDFVYAFFCFLCYASKFSTLKHWES